MISYYSCLLSLSLNVLILKGSGKSIDFLPYFLTKNSYNLTKPYRFKIDIYSLQCAANILESFQNPKDKILIISLIVKTMYIINSK